MSAAEDSTGENTAQGLTPQVIGILRMGMLGMIVLFGVVAWYLSSSGQIEPADEGLTSTVQYIFLAFLAAALAGTAVMRQRADQAETFAQRASMLIVGYALAEGVALVGAVYLLLTGSTMFFLGGLLVFLLTLKALPIQAPTDE